MNELLVDYSFLIGSVGQILSKERAEVLILGLGESGLAMARWLLRCGYPVRVADTRLAPPKAEELRSMAISDSKIPFVELRIGEWSLELLDSIKLVAISPGISIYDEKNTHLISACEARNIPIWGEFEFFSCALERLAKNKARPYLPKILAVTGTNGKTTVCKLVDHLLQQAHISTALAGNISPALMDRFRVALESVESIGWRALPDVWVIEASSFQLVSTRSFYAHAAALLNITQDHLDWHQSFSEYSLAKKKIFSGLNLKEGKRKIGTLSSTFQKKGTLRILCRDDPGSMSAYSSKDPCITVGTDLPTRVGDYGVMSNEGENWLVQLQDKNIESEKQNFTDEKAENFRVLICSDGKKGAFRCLLPIAALKIHGKHNICNALSALVLAKTVGVSFEVLLKALQTYGGEPHRMELITTAKGINFIDDSKATNIASTLAALDTLIPGKEESYYKRRCLLIAGGDGKGQDFSLLRLPISAVCRGVFLIGRDAKNIAAEINDQSVKVQIFSSLNEAVKAAVAYADSGDIVLLSPACASLDMFQGYAHRGRMFRDAVRHYAVECGNSLNNIAENQ